MMLERTTTVMPTTKIAIGSHFLGLTAISGRSGRKGEYQDFLSHRSFCKGPLFPFGVQSKFTLWRRLKETLTATRSQLVVSTVVGVYELRAEDASTGKEDPARVKSRLVRVHGILSREEKRGKGA
jgi:hypothetical protein